MMNVWMAVARCLLAGLLLVLTGLASAAQQNFPTKPIRLISPYAAGGGNSTMGRLIAQKLTENWGQQVIVDSRPGGNTIIGTEALVKSTPDGYTMLLVGSSHVVVPLVLDAPYHPLKDFTAVASAAKYELILVVHPSVAASLQELIALAKAKPGQLNYATWGSGSTSHLGMELFSEVVGVKMQHVPYKGTGPAMTDVIGGHVQIFLSTPSTVIPQIKAGRLKGIAIGGESRSPAVPEVPTFAEGGLPGFDAKSWYGLVAPAGTPKIIVERISSEISRIVATGDMREKLNAQGVEPFFLNSDQFTALLRTDMEKWSKVIKAAHIKLEN